MKKTVVICDTQPIAMQGMRALLAGQTDLALAAEANSLMAGMELVRNLAPAVLVIDKAFGLQPVMDWIASIRTGGRHTAAVIWGNVISEAEALRMMQAGTQGVVRKTAPLNSLLDCLRNVSAGNAWMDDLMLQQPFKPVAQEVRRDVFRGGDKIPETRSSQEQIPNHQQGPAIAQQIESAGHRARRTARAEPG